MVQKATFGRRGVQPSAPVRGPARPDPVNPQIEAFAASLREAEPSDAAEFARWRRRRLPHSVLLVVVGFALMAAGAACFVLHAPWWLSLGLEAAGLAGNAWLRRERRSQASAIAAWSPDE